MTEWAVTVNLGGERQDPSRKAGMLTWTDKVLGDKTPAIIFAQESYGDWLALVESAGYRVILGEQRDNWTTRSALVCRNDLDVERLDPDEVRNLYYHGSYVAAGVWRRQNAADLVLASVHASPNPDFADPVRYGWPYTPDTADRRHGGADPRWPNDRWWDSDFVLMTIRDLHRELGMSVLAAGDLNESLLDDPEGGTWACEYFARAREYGLRPWLHETWEGERRTRGVLQLDHVLVSNDGASLLSADPEPHIDGDWGKPEAAAGLSDHAPIWFALAVGEVRDEGAGGESNGKTMANEEGQQP